MHQQAILWVALHGPVYNTDDLKGFLTDFHRLTKEQLAYRFKKSQKFAFPNYVDFLTALWTDNEFHQGSGKHYRLTERGWREAERIRDSLGANTWQDALERLRRILDYQEARR